MRNVIPLVLYGLFCVTAANVVSAFTRPVEASVQTAPVEKVVAREIVLVDEFGQPRITLKASANGSGIWVGDHNGIVKDGLVSITSNGKTAAIGYYAPGAKIDGCDFAISGNDGRAYIQVRKKDGQFDLFDPADLKK